MKEQKNTLEKEINEMEASKLWDIEFKVMVIRMLNSMKKNTENKKEPIRKEEYNIWNEEYAERNRQ